MHHEAHQNVTGGTDLSIHINLHDDKFFFLHAQNFGYTDIIFLSGVQESIILSCGKKKNKKKKYNHNLYQWFSGQFQGSLIQKTASCAPYFNQNCLESLILSNLVQKKLLFTL